MSLLSALIYNLRIYKVAKPLYGGIGHVLTLHRVVQQLDENRLAWSRNLEITAGYLEETVNYFINNNYDIISLDEMHRRLTEQKTLAKKFVVFTFDDGYEDNFIWAYPIFKKHNLPFAIYITKALIENQLKCWWYDVEDILLCYNNITLGELTLETKTKKQKELAYLKIRHLIIHTPFETGYAFYNALMAKYPPCKSYSNWKPMSKDQLAILNDDALVTLGAHTVNHFSLSKLQLAEATFEVLESKTYLEHLLQKPIEHFSYPYGSADEAGAREFEIVNETGFITATTTRRANIFKDHKNSLFALPRLPLIETPKEKMFFKMSLSGFLPAYLNKCKRLVTL